jgi:hypothetical protein
MIRRLIAGLVVVGLAIGVWALWPREEPDPSPTTTVNAVDTTTTSVPDPVTTTTLESNVVTTVEEAEAILRELWFGWFEGIYNQDEDRIREVVASQTALENAVAQFGVMSFATVPSAEDLEYSTTELLRNTEDCLVIWTTTHISGFATAQTSDVHVLRWSGDGWLFASLWVHKNDLWETDCDSQLEPLS